METDIRGSFHIQDDKITFQRFTYIEDGWYVEMTDDNIVLFEIPTNGGETKRICAYWDLITAIKAGTELT